MEALPGFVSVPRLAGSPRPAGAFFSATVEASVGPGQWRVRLDGSVQTVTTEVPLVVGQELRLKSVGLQGGRWVLQLLPGPLTPGPSGEPAPLTPLAVAFLGRGLPAAAEKLTTWGRWLANGALPSDKEAWAAGLESRNEGPRGSLASALDPWLAWQRSLEEGTPKPPPDDGEFWDLWNLRQPSRGSPWVVVPLHWVHEGTSDSGLLQARWNPPGQRFDRWHLTAAPASTPFRLEAVVGPRSLELTWRFFRESDRLRWATWTPGWGERLSSPDCAVTLTVASTAPGPADHQRGVDVQA